jgi:hypothetical protein
MKKTFQGFLGCVTGTIWTLLLSAAASATTYYVSTSGSNSNHGLTVGSAWRNIQ